MQNKANFLKDKINAIFFDTKDYENSVALRFRKNKAKQSQFVFFTVLRAKTIAFYQIYYYDFIKAE